MDLKEKLCSIEQGEHLKELGIKQDSSFYWTDSEKWGIMPKRSIDFTGKPTSLFDVMELNQMLPLEITHNEKSCDLHTWRRKDGEWLCYYNHVDKNGFMYVPVCDTSTDKNLAIVLANLLIYILEH